MKMKKKVLSAAVLAAMSVGNAEAVNISQDGTGEVLIVPFYTVQGGESTLFSVVNTTGETKATKIRFRESMNSREVLDFNLYLSPYDVWTGEILEDEVGGGAKIITNDNSCTVPPIPEGGVAFKDLGYTGGETDDGGMQVDGTVWGIERTREGYIELFEMGVADETNPVWDQNGNGITDSTHHESGVPDYCQGLMDAWRNRNQWDPADGDPNDGITQPSGGLMGAAAIINKANGTEYGVPVTVLDSFSDVARHNSTGTLAPTLANVSPARSAVIMNDGDGDTLRVYRDDWLAVNGDLPEDAVTAVLQTRSLMNEYTVNPNVEAATDWVVTFPTKAFYVDQREYPRRPFSDIFYTEISTNPYYPGNGYACEGVQSRWWDREENNKDNPLDFSPMPGGLAGLSGTYGAGSGVGSGSSGLSGTYGAGSGVRSGSFGGVISQTESRLFPLCYEANVINFGGSDVLSSAKGVPFDLDLPDFRNGWAQFTFGYNTQMMQNGGTGIIYHGLPAIGFRATRIMNSGLGVGAAYAVSVPHAYQRVVTASTAAVEPAINDNMTPEDVAAAELAVQPAAANAAQAAANTSGRTTCNDGLCPQRPNETNLPAAIFAVATWEESSL